MRNRPLAIWAILRSVCGGLGTRWPEARTRVKGEKPDWYASGSPSCAVRPRSGSGQALARSESARWRAGVAAGLLVAVAFAAMTALEQPSRPHRDVVHIASALNASQPQRQFLSEVSRSLDALSRSEFTASVGAPVQPGSRSHPHRPSGNAGVRASHTNQRTAARASTSSGHSTLVSHTVATSQSVSQGTSSAGSDSGTTAAPEAPARNHAGATGAGATERVRSNQSTTSRRRSRPGPQGSAARSAATATPSAARPECTDTRKALMLTRPLHHLRRNVIAYLALFLALGAGGGYAMAATKTKTITVCADKTTGVLHLKTRGRCKRGQTRVTLEPAGTPRSARGAGSFGSARGTGSRGVGARVGIRSGFRRSGCLDPACVGRHVSADDHSVRRARRDSTHL